ncbi:MAG: helix-turn-helix domain-containing protein [Clostridia bacterium]|nr:helix-turn-helix domain-containing protein [Clostridia bacterium]
MQRILDLIEATLDAEITPAELAEKSGYSLWHFLHLFQRAVGQPLCRYRTRRRLAHAIWDVSRGMGVTDAALRWGFGSHSGFYRAFRLEYGVSPRAWLRSHRVKEPVVPLLTEEVFKMLTREKFREALTQWGCDLPLAPVTWAGSGEISETAMYAGDDLVLKAYRDEPAARLAIALADALDAQGIPAAKAVPLPDGALMLPIAGVQMTLCRRVKGVPLEAAELIRHPEEGLRVGAALANLHKATAALEASWADDEPWAEHILNWALPRVQGILPEDYLTDFAARVEALRELPTALIHRDPNPSNLIDTGDAIGFVDFDLSRRFARVFDPCYTMTAVLSEVFGRDELPWKENWPVMCRAILAGYESVTALSAEERAAVPTLMQGNELLCIAAFASSSKYKDVFEVNMRMLPYIIENIAE